MIHQLTLSSTSRLLTVSAEPQNAREERCARAGRPAVGGGERLQAARPQAPLRAASRAHGGRSPSSRDMLLLRRTGGSVTAQGEAHLQRGGSIT